MLRAPAGPRLRPPAIAALGLFAAACARSSVPDPRAAADAYARAASGGDADAIYGMMTSSARKERSIEQVRRLVKDEGPELAEEGRSFAAKDVRVEATARLRFADGEEAALDLQNGTFYVTSAGALPGGGRTPEEALDQLRRVLARRNYTGLMRILTPATRAAVEEDLRGLVTGLDHPETLPVSVAGDTASIPVPGGHHVRLRRESGVWRIDDFD
jgi:hypothetical protein